MVLVGYSIYNNQKKLRFRMVRIIWNVFSILIGAMLGRTVGIVTVIISFLLAPVIEMVKLYIRNYNSAFLLE